MKTGLYIILACCLAGCAQDRLINQTRELYPNYSKLREREVVDNIDATIDNPARIPTSTTFAAGQNVSGESFGVNFAVPFQVLPTNAGTATTNFGAFNNNFQISISSETDGVRLKALREAYQAAVYPDQYKDLAKTLAAVLRRPLPFLFWKRLDGPRTPFDRDPPPEAVLVGRGHSHEIYTSDPEAYSLFVLLTFGQAPNRARATTPGSASASGSTRPGRVRRSRERPSAETGRSSDGRIVITPDIRRRLRETAPARNQIQELLTRPNQGSGPSSPFVTPIQ